MSRSCISPLSSLMFGSSNLPHRMCVFIACLPCTTTQVYAKITQKRYRDVSVAVRSAALDGLSKVMLALPDIYVQVNRSN